MKHQDQPKQPEDKLIQPFKSKLLTVLLEQNQMEEPLVKEYLAKYEEYQKNSIKRRNLLTENKPVEVVPELQPIDPEAMYQLFLKVFEIVNGKKFDESQNEYASRKLARTLMLYFIRNSNFLNSPLLNSKSVPDRNKGIAIFGDYGVGKSAIINTFHHIFRVANDTRVMIKDYTGTEQMLGRYKLGFGSYTSNSVVMEYERINKADKEENREYYLSQFIRKHHHGFKNYDDVMAERTASNYGKIEIFKEIFEERYTNRGRTIISLNYVNGSLEDTLDAYAGKYGERLYDRFFEMFNILEIRGKSLRK